MCTGTPEQVSKVEGSYTGQFLKKILEEIRGAKNVAISGHIRPDGDCVGSCMGLYLYLTKELSDAIVDVFLEKPSDVFN